MVMNHMVESVKITQKTNTRNSFEGQKWNFHISWDSGFFIFHFSLKQLANHFDQFKNLFLGTAFVLCWKKTSTFDNFLYLILAHRKAAERTSLLSCKMPKDPVAPFGITIQFIRHGWRAPNMGY